jgi:uncharacterized coiled-coil protein SlyX
MDVTAIILALIAVGGTIYTNRDKWKFDARMVQLEATVKAQTTTIAEQAAKIATLETDVTSCHTERAADKAKIAAQETQIATLTATNERQQGELNSLQSELTKLKTGLAAQGVRADSAEHEKPKG